MSERQTFYINWYESDGDSWLQHFNSRREADEYGAGVVWQIERDVGPCRRVACKRVQFVKGQFDD